MLISYADRAHGPASAQRAWGRPVQLACYLHARATGVGETGADVGSDSFDALHVCAHHGADVGSDSFDASDGDSSESSDESDAAHDDASGGRPCR